MAAGPDNSGGAGFALRKSGGIGGRGRCLGEGQTLPYPSRRDVTLAVDGNDSVTAAEESEEGANYFFNSLISKPFVG